MAAICRYRPSLRRNIQSRYVPTTTFFPATACNDRFNSATGIQHHQQIPSDRLQHGDLYRKTACRYQHFQIMRFQSRFIEYAGDMKGIHPDLGSSPRIKQSFIGGWMTGASPCERFSPAAHATADVYRTSLEHITCSLSCTVNSSCICFIVVLSKEKFSLEKSISSDFRHSCSFFGR